MACRTSRPKGDLVRVVRAPDGSVAIDPTGRAPGRGAYLCRDAACWQAAARRHALEHTLGAPLPEDVVEVLAAGPDVLATPTVGGVATPTDHPLNLIRGDQPPTRHSPMSRGGAHGQE